ncbi:MAG: hypothetical protein EXR99_07505 [Gemmataceae bacterium]|nr:hypothetical protein [Gemmataceae bacterium]
MTRETKAGMVVAASFVGLMAAVLVKKFVLNPTNGNTENAVAQATEKGKSPEVTPIQQGNINLVPVPGTVEIKLTTADEKNPPPPAPVENKDPSGIPPLPGAAADKSAIPAFPGTTDNKGGIPPLPGGASDKGNSPLPPVDPPPPTNVPGPGVTIPLAPAAPTTAVPPIGGLTTPPPPSSGIPPIPIVPPVGVPPIPMTPGNVETVLPPPAPPGVTPGNTLPPSLVSPLPGAGSNPGAPFSPMPTTAVITPPPPPAPASGLTTSPLTSTSPAGAVVGRSNGFTPFDALEGPPSRSEFIPASPRGGVPLGNGGYIAPSAAPGNGGFITPPPVASSVPLGPNQIPSAAPLASTSPLPMTTNPGAVLTLPSTVTAPAATNGNNFASAPSALTPPKVETWSEQVYFCQPGDSYASVSQKVYLTADYAKALQLWNENHPRNRVDAPKTGVLIPGQELYFPPALELSRRYGAFMPKLSPVSSVSPAGGNPVFPGK